MLADRIAIDILAPCNLLAKSISKRNLEEDKQSRKNNRHADKLAPHKLLCTWDNYLTRTCLASHCKKFHILVSAQDKGFLWEEIQHIDKCSWVPCKRLCNLLRIRGRHTNNDIAGDKRKKQPQKITKGSSLRQCEGELVFLIRLLF